MEGIYNFLWFFFIYSFLGWCVEVAYNTIAQGSIVNRGFLNGPYCPIYGFGMISILLIFEEITGVNVRENNGIVLFISGILIASAIELFGGWILDKLFHIRWWDYSDKPFNFKGYICLEFSIYWGLGIVFIYRIVHPTISFFVTEIIPHGIGMGLLCVIGIIMLADTVLTVAMLIGLNKQISELDRLSKDMRRFSDELSNTIGSKALENVNTLEKGRIQTALAAMELKEDVKEGLSEHYDELLERRAASARAYDELKDKIYKNKVFGVTRLVRSYPDSVHRNYSEVFEKIKDNVNNR